MQELLIVAGVHILGAMSPGPDLALVLQTSLKNGRKVGVLTAVGIGLGILVHVTYGLLGIGLLVSKSILLFNIVKWIGALYLMYLGVKALWSTRRLKTDTEDTLDLASNPQTISARKAVAQGFLTNVLNPKATLFFLGLFTQVISPSTSTGMKVLYGAEMTIATMIWFSIVALLLTQRPVRAVYNRIKHHLDRVFGTVLIALGIKVALSSK